MAKQKAQEEQENVVGTESHDELSALRREFEEFKRRYERTEKIANETAMKLQVALTSIYQIKRMMEFGQPRGQIEAILRSLSTEIQRLRNGEQ